MALPSFQVSFMGLAATAMAVEDRIWKAMNDRRLNLATLLSRGSSWLLSDGIQGQPREEPHHADRDQDWRAANESSESGQSKRVRGRAGIGIGIGNPDGPGSVLIPMCGLLSATPSSLLPRWPSWTRGEVRAWDAAQQVQHRSRKTACCLGSVRWGLPAKQGPDTMRWSVANCDQSMLGKRIRCRSWQPPQRVRMEMHRTVPGVAHHHHIRGTGQLLGLTTTAPA